MPSAAERNSHGKNSVLAETDPSCRHAILLQEAVWRQNTERTECDDWPYRAAYKGTPVFERVRHAAPAGMKQRVLGAMGHSDRALVLHRSSAMFFDVFRKGEGRIASS